MTGFAPTDRGASPSAHPSEPLPSATELRAIMRRLSRQQRSALRLLARDPCRIRQGNHGTLYVDTGSSAHIAMATWHALERKGLAYRDHAAHAASALGQRLALTHPGLAVLNHLSPVTYPTSKTQLWPSAPPPSLTSRAAHAAPARRAVHHR